MTGRTSSDSDPMPGNVASCPSTPLGARGPPTDPHTLCGAPSSLGGLADLLDCAATWTHHQTCNVSTLQFLQFLLDAPFEMSGDLTLWHCTLANVVSLLRLLIDDHVNQLERNNFTRIPYTPWSSMIHT